MALSQPLTETILHCFSMTYAYHCQSCGPKITISDDGETPSEGNWGMKSSCCHKCSNPDCKDYGECDCMDGWLERQREMMSKLIEEDPEKFARRLAQMYEEE